MQRPEQIEARVEARHRLLLMMWFALLTSMTIFAVLPVVITSQSTEPNTTLSFAFMGAAFMLVVSSVLSKQQVVHRAVEKRDAAMLQTGYIISFALCESAAILGLVDHVVTGSKYYFLSFLLGLLGMLVHFPKKDHVRAAIA
jgi:F0F1-type ATP synthase membrane subunit c/vacuolar-type H+-ATPase subunit K